MNRRGLLKFLGLGGVAASVPAVLEAKPSTEAQPTVVRTSPGGDPALFEHWLKELIEYVEAKPPMQPVAGAVVWYDPQPYWRTLPFGTVPVNLYVRESCVKDYAKAPDFGALLEQCEQPSVDPVYKRLAYELSEQYMPTDFKVVPRITKHLGAMRLATPQLTIDTAELDAKKLAYMLSVGTQLTKDLPPGWEKAKVKERTHVHIELSRQAYFLEIWAWCQINFHDEEKL